MRITANIRDERVLDLVRDYARRRGVSLSAALERLLSSGARRLAAVTKYARSAKGRAVARRYADRRAERARRRAAR